MDGIGGLGLAAKISGLWPKGLSWGDARNQELEPGSPVVEGEVLEPGQGPGRIGGHGGWDTSSDILGGFTYKAPDGKTYHGQEAMDMYEMDNPGEGGPHDGITNESGMYWGESQWRPALGQGGSSGWGQIGRGWGS